MRKSIIYLSLVFVLLIKAISAQTTEFTYKGRLSDSGIPANGAYDLEFKIFDSTSGGTLLATLDRLNTTVANGDYTISLDYGSGVFNGSSRYLEISYRLSGTGNPYTLLSPRDNLTVPYSINAANATTASNSSQLGGVTASQFVQTTDTRLSDARNPLAGSFSYVQNSTAQQAGSNFFISGTGKANTFDATTQFSIAGNRVLGTPGTNTYLGSGTGAFNTTGIQNTYAGLAAGMNNATGTNNSFFGFNAGWQSTGLGANSFFGSFAGLGTTTGSYNSFFGTTAGQLTTTGQQNTFLGFAAGMSNTTGNSNTLIGDEAQLGSANLSNASAFGAKAFVTANNSLVLGSISGVNDAAANTNIGIGISAPTSKLQVIDSSNTGLRVQTNASGGTVASFGGNGAFNIDASGIGGGRFQVAENGSVTVGHSVNLGGNVGSLTVFGDSQLNTVTAANGIKDNVLGSGGTTTLCRNASNLISFCSSSSRYKKNVQLFTPGLSLIDRLQPVSFKWIANDESDLGLVAEDVAKVDPLLTTRNDKGEVEGVKYDRVAVVAVNAIKEQQGQINALRKTVALQQAQIDQLKRMIVDRYNLKQSNHTGRWRISR